MHIENYRILVVDDEPDIYTITKLALRGLKYEGRPVLIEAANSAQEARDYVSEHPGTAVILLDVVMESSSAGLDFCKWLRQEQNNKRSRILLRTGQPGSAPERQVIDEYEIDGYLAKSEMTKTRLYSAVKTGLKTYSELFRAHVLEQSLAYLHEVVLELNDISDRKALLQKMVESACILSGSPLALFYLTHPPSDESYLLYSCNDPDILEPQERIDEIIQELNQTEPNLKGTMVHLPMDAGEGWFYFDSALQDDPIAQKVLPMMAAHAAHAFGMKLNN